MSAGEIRRVILHNRTSKKTVGGERREDSMSFVCFDTRSHEGVDGSLCKYACVCLCVVGKGGGDIHVLPFDSGSLCLAGEWGKDRIWGDFP